MNKIFSYLAFTLLSFTAFCQEYDVLGIGDPMIDLIYNVDESLLNRLEIEKGGSLKIDFSSFTKLLNSLPRPPIKVVPGGSCPNAVKGLARLGHQAAFLGKVGQDEMGGKFQNSLSDYQITSLLITCDKNTSQVASLVTPDGERTMRCCLGAANDLKAQEISDNLFKRVRHLHMDGYMFYNSGVVLKSAALAKEAGATVSIDLASFEVVNKHRETIEQLLNGLTDIVFANEDEALALTGLNPEEAAFELQKRCPIAVILVGEKGCWVGSDGKVFHCLTTPLGVLDSTGAGDLFSSGFLHGYLKGLPLEQCAKFGNLIGGACVQVIGAELPEEKWQEVLNMMN